VWPILQRGLDLVRPRGHRAQDPRCLLACQKGACDQRSTGEANQKQQWTSACQSGAAKLLHLQEEVRKENYSLTSLRKAPFYCQSYAARGELHTR